MSDPALPAAGSRCRALVDALPETRWQLALVITGIHWGEGNRVAAVSGGGGRHCSVGTHSLWSHLWGAGVCCGAGRGDQVRMKVHVQITRRVFHA